MLRRIKDLITSDREERREGPLLNRLLFVEAHNAGMTGDDSIFLKVLKTPGYVPSPPTLNYALTQMLYGCHMIQTSGILPVSTLDAVIDRGAYVDTAYAPTRAGWGRLFGQREDRANPDFLTPLWHAIDLANHGRTEYLTRLLQEPVSVATLEHFMADVRDPKITAKFMDLIERGKHKI